MIRSPDFRRIAGVALAASLLAGPAGCRPAQHVAAEKAGLVRGGMTRAEVLRTLGEPDTREYLLADEAGEVWRYSYRQGLDPNPWKVLIGVAALTAYVALTIATCWRTLPSWSEPDQQPYSWDVRVIFDPESGCVRRVVVP